MMHQERGTGRIAGVRQISDNPAPLGCPSGKAAEAGVEREAVLLQNMDKAQADLFGIGVGGCPMRRRKEPAEFVKGRNITFLRLWNGLED